MSELPKPFLDHLDELRYRLIFSISTIGLGTVICYAFSDTLLKILTSGIDKLVFIQPLEAFMVKIKASVLFGVLLSLPVILFQLWQFIKIGLKPLERKLVGVYLPVAIIIFFSGTTFAFFLVVPFCVKFMLSTAGPNLIPMITVSSYFSLLVWTLIIFGMMFELPLIILLLTRLGIVTPKMLRSQRKIAILITFIVAAILTPPDVVSQMMLAIPILVLFEISILVATFASRKSKSVGLGPLNPPIGGLDA